MHAGRQSHVLIPVAGRVGWLSAPRCGWQGALTAAHLRADIPRGLAQQPQLPRHRLHSAAPVTGKQHKYSLK